MKIGIVGAGNVGTACIMAIIARGAAHEIVVIDSNRNLSASVVTDIQYGTPLQHPVRIIAGDYVDLIGAELVIVAVGINEKAGGAMDRNDPAGRLRLLERNAFAIADVIPKVVEEVADAAILIVTNPPEPLAELARHYAGHDKVFSAGTYLDSLRFRFHIARELGLHGSQIEAQAVGEHGNSRVLLWSSARVAGAAVLDLVAPDATATFIATIEEQVRNANITIIEGAGASKFGIGFACGRIVDAMTRDERSIFQLGSHLSEYDTTISIPVVLGRRGIVCPITPAMSRTERQALEQSAEILRNVCSQLLRDHSRYTHD